MQLSPTEERSCDLPKKKNMDINPSEHKGKKRMVLEHLRWTATRGRKRGEGP